MKQLVLRGARFFVSRLVIAHARIDLCRMLIHIFFFCMQRMMREIYSSSTVIVWSFWWGIGFAIVEMVLDYQVVLFNEINGEDVATGYIFSAARLSAAAMAMFAGYSRPMIVRIWSNVMGICVKQC